MDDHGRIYVEFSPELKARLNNRLALQDILNAADIDAVVEWHAVPPTDADERSKALVETITAISVGAAGVASLAAAVRLIESAITHFLDHKAVRDTGFAYWVHEPLLDGKGRPILDSTGMPRLRRVRKGGFDELPAVSGGGMTISVGQKGVSASVGDDGQPKAAKGRASKD